MRINNIKPLGDQVLVLVDSAEEVSAGGLLLVHTEPVAKNTGMVIAIGDAVVIRVKPGDRVVMEKGMGRRFELPEVRKNAETGATWTEHVGYMLVGYYDILAVMEE